MEIAEAFNAAADYIEAHPDQYRFVENSRPEMKCGSPGCMLGWVGVFLDMTTADIDMSNGDESFADAVARKIGTSMSDFLWQRLPQVEVLDFDVDARKAAETMRAYAEKFHS